MSIPFSRDAITRSWHPLNWERFAPLDDPSLDYVSYYGIDFAARLPRLEHGFGYFDAAGHTLGIHVWRPPSPKGSVFVCHGYFDHVGLYGHVIGHLLEKGFAVVAYDLPGHGLSSGPPADIDDFKVYREVLERCLSLARTHLPKPWHVVAQSTGGAIVMDFLLHHRFDADEAPFDQVILLAPLVRPFKWGTARWLHTLIRPFARSIKRVFTINSGDPDFLDFLENRDPLQPRRLPASWVTALKRWLPGFERAAPVPLSPVVIQGDQDETVDWRYNLDIIRRKFQEPRIHILEGARHQLANEQADYRERIFRIIDDCLNVPEHAARP
ncbi:MAG: alpha/beta hydrolase [Alcanivorax sp.]|uniref:alpha/beta hydrolase n=1 Tax=Alloalcanivorax xenomutans TaxID=1094342 RepID=UPI0017B100A4|nr:alpha/beta hydrolase [Alcanivorax sp.]